jgi:hypothetical protein
MDYAMKQIVCMNWGTAYGADYVNRLYGMVSRNITGPFKLVCYTDNREGIHPDVELHDCPEVDIPHPKRNRGFRKISLWADQLPGLEGDVLFLDLDIVITDNIDCFFDYEPDSDFVVIHNWTQPEKRIGNTSAYRFKIGSHPYLLSNLLENHEEVMARFTNSQTYISYTVNNMSFWPDEWCRSFKVHCVPRGVKRWMVEPHLPEGTKLVAFPGTPNPPDAAEGRWPSPMHKRIYKHIRPTSWVAENWKP